MENLKEIKRGEVLLKEGQPIENIVLVKTGRLSLTHERNGRIIELLAMTAGQTFGEQGLYAPARSPYTIKAAQNSAVLEMPIKIVKPRFEAADTLIKILLKGSASLLNEAKNSIKSLKLETDNSPCPEKIVPRVFGIIALLTQHFGKTVDGESQISWMSLRLYGNRMFLESVDRLRSALDLLAKLGLVTFVYGKDDEGTEVLETIKISRLQGILDFADFYQFHYYKPGTNEVIHVDRAALELTKALIDLSETAEKNHKGFVTLEYNGLLTSLKDSYRIDLKPTHLDLLEKKGLLAHRQSKDKGLFLAFDREEFQKMHYYWQILSEIDKWNDKGFVEMQEAKTPAASRAGNICPDCQVEISENQKFCANCGFKLVA